MNSNNIEITVKDKLIGLFQLQIIDSKIDEIRRLRGELPLKIQDLEDEIAGIKTRESNFSKEIANLSKQVDDKKAQIKSAQALIKRYNLQQKNVRNNREYDSLTKETEYQNLDIKLSEKRIKEYKSILSQKKLQIEDTHKEIADKVMDLNASKLELDAIVTETKKDEEKLQIESDKLGNVIEERLLTAYARIRNAMRNGLAVVSVDRDACGGCFNKLPPQRQLDIVSNKKIIVCEFCGRILIDKSIMDKEEENEEELDFDI